MSIERKSAKVRPPSEISGVDAHRLRLGALRTETLQGELAARLAQAGRLAVPSNRGTAWP
jgi:hypothetical protein